MPPELRRRGQPPPPQQLSDSDDALDFDEELSDIPDDDEVAVDEAEGFEEEEEEELGDFEGEEEGQSAGKTSPTACSSMASRARKFHQMLYQGCLVQVLSSRTHPIQCVMFFGHVQEPFKQIPIHTSAPPLTTSPRLARSLQPKPTRTHSTQLPRNQHPGILDCLQ